jgi:hypothetical protein
LNMNVARNKDKTQQIEWDKHFQFVNSTRLVFS